MDIVPSVAMKGGRFRKEISTPFTRPTKPENSMHTTIVTNTGTL